MGSALSHLNVPSSAETYSRALEGLVGVDEVILRENPHMPALYEAGVSYKLPKHRVWRYPNEIVRDGWGDCEGLSCWRVAELHVTGVDPDARVLVYPTGPRRWHAVVGRGDGWIDDPSIVCGMPHRADMPWTVAEVLERGQTWPAEAGMVVGAIDDAFNDAFPSFRVVQHSKGHTGVLTLPTSDGRALIYNTSPSPNAGAAVQKADNIMRDVSTAMATDPYALAQLNPYSAAAVQAAADPRVQQAAATAAAVAEKDSGILAKPGDWLEQNQGLLAQAGPYGKLAATIMNIPGAKDVRQLSHKVFKKIPGLGDLF